MRVYFIRKRYLFLIWILMGAILGTLYMYRIKKEHVLSVFGAPAYGAVIAVDAGHGGIDPGALSPNGVREAEINLKIAKKLRDYLENDGAKVIMTRNSDEGLYDKDTKGSRKSQDMARRVEILQKSEPDIVISIHLNSYGQPQYFGAQTFFMRGSWEGEALAEAIQGQLLRVLDRDNKRDIKAAEDFLMLKAVDSPSVLVECGFLSNPEEEQLLNDDDYQDNIAWAIYCGIVSYLSRPNEQAANIYENRP